MTTLDKPFEDSEVSDVVGELPPHRRHKLWIICNTGLALTPFAYLRRVARWARRRPSPRGLHGLPAPCMYMVSRAERQLPKALISPRHDSGFRVVKAATRIPKLRGGGDRRDDRSIPPSSNGLGRSSPPPYLSQQSSVEPDSDAESENVPALPEASANSGPGVLVASSTGASAGSQRTEAPPSHSDSINLPLQPLPSPDYDQENISPVDSPLSHDQARLFIGQLLQAAGLDRPNFPAVANRGTCHPCPIYPDRIHHVCSQLLTGGPCTGNLRSPVPDEPEHPYVNGVHGRSTPGSPEQDHRNGHPPSPAAPPHFEVLSVDGSPPRTRQPSSNTRSNGHNEPSTPRNTVRFADQSSGDDSDENGSSSSSSSSHSHSAKARPSRSRSIDTFESSFRCRRRGSLIRHIQESPTPIRRANRENSMSSTSAAKKIGKAHTWPNARARLLPKKNTSRARAGLEMENLTTAASTRPRRGDHRTAKKREADAIAAMNRAMRGNRPARG